MRYKVKPEIGRQICNQAAALTPSMLIKPSKMRTCTSLAVARILLRGQIRQPTTALYFHHSLGLPGSIPDALPITGSVFILRRRRPARLKHSLIHFHEKYSRHLNVLPLTSVISNFTLPILSPSATARYDVSVGCPTMEAQVSRC